MDLMSSLNEEDMKIKKQIMPLILSAALLTLLLFAHFAITWQNNYRTAIDVYVQDRKHLTINIPNALMLVRVFPDIEVLILEEKKEG
jgi:hypothetical protein